MHSDHVTGTPNNSRKLLTLTILVLEYLTILVLSLTKICFELLSLVNIKNFKNILVLF